MSWELGLSATRLGETWSLALARPAPDSVEHNPLSEQRSSGVMRANFGALETFESTDETIARTGERIMRALYPTVATVGRVGSVVSGHAYFTPEPEHVGAPGWVQGGLSSTVLDYVCARLASTALGMKVATGTLDLRYRQPVLLDGGSFRVEGETEEPRSRTVRVRAAIVSAEGRPLVEASGLFVGVAAL